MLKCLQIYNHPKILVKIQFNVVCPRVASQRKTKFCFGASIFQQYLFPRLSGGPIYLLRKGNKTAECLYGIASTMTSVYGNCTGGVLDAIKLSKYKEWIQITQDLFSGDE